MMLCELPYHIPDVRITAPEHLPENVTVSFCNIRNTPHCFVKGIGQQEGILG
jgi:hypothetical protein